jgi:hypothetical protein
MPVDQYQAALFRLERLFREYGDGCTRADAAWGWRAVGDSLLKFGEVGRQRLEAMRTQKQDRWLAWAAYEVLFNPMAVDRVTLLTEEQAIENHRRFAPPFPRGR